MEDSSVIQSRTTDGEAEKNATGATSQVIPRARGAVNAASGRLGLTWLR
ncbi:hypothetical protein [Sphaerisporangium flaviroseum]